MNPTSIPYTWSGFKSLHNSTRRLISARFLRSIAQGALAVDFTLYLRARAWTAPEIGLLLMAAGLSGAVLSLFIGIASDQIGRRLFLLIYEAGLTLGTALLLINHSVWLLVLIAVLFGFGRGANGASGPFAPAEQAWLAQHIPSTIRGSVFSLNAALQFWGMGIGALLSAYLVHLLPGETGPHAFYPVFFLNLVIALINYLQIFTLKETPINHGSNPRTILKTDATTTKSTELTTIVENEDLLRKKENRALFLLIIVNSVNSLGVGLIAPLLPYWFSVRYGVGPEAIGPVYGLTFFLTGASSLLVGKLSQKVGLTKSIILPRLLGVATLIALPFMPTFTLAAILYIIRSIVNRGSMGARQAFSVGLVRDQRRGLASSLNSVSWNIPSAIGPAIGGWLLGMGTLFWPFLLASLLQFAYIIMFSTMMGKYEPQTHTSLP
ncbi:MFS transporter [Sulfoacidibacillus thermotolerans]|uniref:MFS transporter n=1 Tax=Sulfoacidibacillus thermotolerans TaxID=1765684 RepID=A0A2U3D943_SULT2|nr:MFS transporter [Sulfoacidibacillus thermotolerans]PWI57797.1 MFS transporter [Sulfoacidibacillus thermotolerans]